jgi:hypothetical protein
MAFGCKGLAALLCSEAARRAVQEAENLAENALADGDPTNEVNSVAKVGSDLAPAMRRWFGNGVDNLLKNPNLRPTWISDEQLRQYKKIAEDGIAKYNQNLKSDGAQKGLKIQTLRLQAILKELAQRESERSGY